MLRDSGGDGPGGFQQVGAAASGSIAEITQRVLVNAFTTGGEAKLQAFLRVLHEPRGGDVREGR